jgi:hypothetical protein
MPVIPTFVKLKQEDCKFKSSLGYIESPCLKKKKKERKEKKKQDNNKKTS